MIILHLSQILIATYTTVKTGGIMQRRKSPARLMFSVCLHVRSHICVALKPKVNSREILQDYIHPLDIKPLRWWVKGTLS